MPRLSVDIDLTYLPLSPRDEALPAIDAGIRAVADGIVQRIPDARAVIRSAQRTASGVNVIAGDTQIKIEANLILRGSVHAPVQRDLCDAAVDRFGMFVSAQTLAFEDLYGGKICAALDRQHPRDLYDVHLLLKKEGLTPLVRRAFVVYLAGHRRPMHELLDPRCNDLSRVYDEQFVGMVEEDVSLDELYATRERLVKLIRSGLDESEKSFLLSVKRGDPDWASLGIPHLRDMPALQWKLINIRRMNSAKRRVALQQLESVLQS